MDSRIEEILKKYPNRQREDLIPLLQAIQDREGYLSEQALTMVSKYLSMSMTKIYGVATFYENFRFSSRGRYHIRLCHGTACHVAGASTLLAELEKKLRIREGQTDKEGLFSLEVVHCLGACGLAPIIAINDDYHTGINLEQMNQ
ncbi:MAG: NAD(P)H-dependent oxidoreductase subunit E, partial [Bacteroidales bacterium]|nr:NAD(P)H-dependent oxidoreductase subunit E [Bacteroidales bacterium]